MGIISGSSSNVKTLVHKEDDSSEWRDYPNLNHSVYAEAHLPPVRNKEELVRILDLYQVSRDCVDELFQKTGGVGRYMDAYCKKNFTESRLPDIIQILEGDSMLRSVLHKLFIKNNGHEVNSVFNVCHQ
jgi:hypothetical protein